MLNERETIVINLNSHYYCELIENSIPKKINYILLEDFDLKSLLIKIKLFFCSKKLKKSKQVFGWGKSNPLNFIKISIIILKKSPIFNNSKVYLISHRVFDHLFFNFLAIIFKIKPIIIFHGSCENSTIKYIYLLKYLISKIYFYFEKYDLVTRYFIHEKCKYSYFGNSGILQRPAVINSMRVDACYSKYSNPLVVCNFPERPYFSKEILSEMISQKDNFTICGASNLYDIKSFSREKLIEKYKTSLAYVSILIEPENYYSLTLLDACDAKLPLICLEHPMLTNKFRSHIITFSNFHELEIKINQLRNDSLKWKYYSKKSGDLLRNYFPKSAFIKTWNDIIK